MSASTAFAAQERVATRGTPVAWQAGMDLRHWYPICVERDEATGQVSLCWRDMGLARFTESFFEHTLSRQPREQRRVCRTPLAALASLDDCLAPDAFIFHVSRCGSTLLTQLLAGLPQCVVMSEPPLIDSLLRLHHDSGGALDTVNVLRQAILALGQRRDSAEKHFVLKFDCWHIHSLALLQQAFPGTPCLFLYREPAAVLASHQRQRGPQMVPGMLHPAMLPLPAYELEPGDFDGYAGQVLASLYAAGAAAAAAGKLLLINYNQLPGIVFSELLARFGIAPSAEQLQAMHERTGFHSKNGKHAFDGDPPGADASRLPEIAARLLPAYRALEQLRLGL